MKMFKRKLLLISAILLSIHTAEAQSIIGTKNSNNTNNKPSILVPKETQPINTNKKEIETLNSVLEYVDPETAYNTHSEKTLLSGASVQAIPFINKCMCGPCGTPDPIGGPLCVATLSSAKAAVSLGNAFTSDMSKMESGIKKSLVGDFGIINKIAETISPCPKEPKNLLQAIECQSKRINLAFKDLTDATSKAKDKMNEEMRKMNINKINADIELSMDDKLGTVCESVSKVSGGVDAAKRSEEKYRKTQNTLTAATNLNPAAITGLSGTNEKFSKNSVGSTEARLAAGLAFEMTGDFVRKDEDNKSYVKTKSNDLSPVQFADDGTPIGVVPSAGLPEGYKYDTVLPGADRNYAGMVLDRPVIKNDQHWFAAVNAIVNLINPIPEATNTSSTLSKEMQTTKLVEEKAKQARYSVAQDIASFSTSFREVELPEDGGSKTDGTAASARYIRNILAKYGADESEYADIGEDISEYQFLDSIARRIPQTPLYYATMYSDNPTNIDKEIIKNMATTLTIKWKQYQILEKILASRATTLAVNTERSD